MKTFLASLCLLVSTVALAESSVWKVSRDGNSFYLGGTVHVLRPTDFPLPTEFDHAFAESAAVYFETDLSRLQSTEAQSILMSRGIYSDGKTTLQSVLSEDAWNAAEAYCQKSGIPINQLQTMKPWLFTIMVTALELQKQGVSAEGVDVHFHKKAVEEKKQLGSLESFDDHINYLVNMGAGNESAMVKNSMDDLSELPTVITGIIDAWKSGDLGQIDEYLLKEMRKDHPELFQELLVERNEAWMPKLLELGKTSEVELVLVGVAHIAGNEGLIARLKSEGFDVEQVATATK